MFLYQTELFVNLAVDVGAKDGEGVHHLPGPEHGDAL